MQSRKRANGRGHFHWWVAFVGLAAAVACGGSNDDGPVFAGSQGATGGRGLTAGGSGGSSGRGGTGGKAGNGTGGDTMSEGGEAGAPPGPGGPLVQVTSPPALDDPADGEVLVGSEVAVTCEARSAPGGEPLDRSSVTVELLDPDGNAVDEVAATPGGAADEFSARVILTNLPDNGPVGFRCTAADTSSPALAGSDTVWTFIDHGPLIEVTSPTPESAHALAVPVRFQFRVDPSPVDSPDAQAAVDSVTLEVAGVPVDPGDPDDGAYDVTVNLNDPAVFPDTLRGTVPVTITAVNRREPEPVARVYSYWFVIDGEGPEVTITSPDNGDVVGGQVVLRFTVVDELTPVDRSSIVVRVNTTDHYFEEGNGWAEDTDGFTFLFDSVQAQADSIAQASVTVRASDEAGNPTTGRAITLNLDNQPPIVDLDPGMVRESKGPPNNFCSFPFDPIGTLPPSDGSTVVGVQTFRAIVWEQTNQAPNQTFLFYAYPDEQQVVLYMQPDPSEPFLVDTDGDPNNICDDLVETPAFLNLTGLDPAGSSWFGAEMDDTEVMPQGCEYEGGSAPDILCDPFGSDMTRVIEWDYDETVPVIYATNVFDNSGACLGSHWETRVFGEGWVCFAAQAVDRVGNVGISPPLRLCMDDGVGAPPDCSGPPPPCTDGCTPPPGFAGGLVSVR